MKSDILKKHFSWSFVAGLLLILPVIPAWSGEITYIDNSYQAGDTLTASDLNGKFNEIKGAVNDNNVRTGTVESTVTNLGNTVNGLGTTLTNTNAVVSAHNDLLAKIPTPTTYASVVRLKSAGWSRFNADGSTSSISIDGTVILTVPRSYGLVVLDRATGNITFNGSFDVSGNIADADALAANLATRDENQIVIIVTFDDPRQNRFGTNGILAEQMLRCGASSRFINESGMFRYRSAYIMVGICGKGQGTGKEFYVGDVNSDTNAYIDESVTIIDGNFSSSYRAEPRVIHTADTRAGCPGAAPANSDLITQNFTLNRVGNAVVSAKMIRNIAGRADLGMYLNGADPSGNPVAVDVLLDVSLTYSSSPQWDQANLSWVGALQAGTYTLSLRSPTADVWGCGANWGHMSTVLYE